MKTDINKLTTGQKIFLCISVACVLVIAGFILVDGFKMIPSVGQVIEQQFIKDDTEQVVDTIGEHWDEIENGFSQFGGELQSEIDKEQGE